MPFAASNRICLNWRVSGWGALRFGSAGGETVSPCICDPRVGTVAPMPKQVNEMNVAWIEASELPSGDQAPTWIMILPAGTVTLRDQRRSPIAGGRQDLERIVAATQERLGNVQMVVDYDHAASRILQTGQPAKAAGWVQQIEARADGIYAQVEWTPAAQAAIKDREYRYVSPTFLIDKKSGQVRTIRNVALVNEPAIDMEPIAASLQPDNGDTMDKIAEALGLKADASKEDVLTALNARLATSTAICAALGLKPDAQEEQIEAAVTALKSDDIDPTKYVPVAQFKTVMDELKGIKTDLASDRAEAQVEAAITSGKLAPAAKDWGLALAKTDPKAFADFVEVAPTLTEPQLGGKKREAVEAALDETDRAVMAQLGLSEEDMLKSKKEAA